MESGQKGLPLAAVRSEAIGTFPTCRADTEDVRSSGKIGSEGRTAKMARLTQSGHPHFPKSEMKNPNFEVFPAPDAR
jgi:hypothetical protein